MGQRLVSVAEQVSVGGAQSQYLWPEGQVVNKVAGSMLLPGVPTFLTRVVTIISKPASDQSTQE